MRAFSPSGACLPACLLMLMVAAAHGALGQHNGPTNRDNPAPAPRRRALQTDPNATPAPVRETPSPTQTLETPFPAQTLETPSPTQTPETPAPTEVPETPGPTEVPETPAPTEVPETPGPTMNPTLSPTLAPTPAPTTPGPTPSPTLSPTPAPTFSKSPTLAPTPAPTPPPTFSFDSYLRYPWSALTVSLLDHPGDLLASHETRQELAPSRDANNAAWSTSRVMLILMMAYQIPMEPCERGAGGATGANTTLCVDLTSPLDRQNGVGVYYEQGCQGRGCDILDENDCRQCLFDRVAFSASGQEGEEEIVDCPCCVPITYKLFPDDTQCVWPETPVPTGTPTTLAQLLASDATRGGRGRGPLPDSVMGLIARTTAAVGAVGCILGLAF